MIILLLRPGALAGAALLRLLLLWSSSSFSGKILGAAAAGQPHYQCPCVRYVRWADLTSTQRSHAGTLGYDSVTWNYADGDETVNSVEEDDFESLSFSKRNAAVALGYNVDTWDCCINHYGNYDWIEFVGTVDAFAGEALEELGWTQEMWDVGRECPASEYKTWCSSVTSDEEEVCLSEDEKDAATEICFTESTYRRDSMDGGRPFAEYVVPDHCPDWVPLTPAPTPPPSPALAPTPATDCPCVRYLEWSDLGSTRRQLVRERLGYNRRRWHYEGGARNVVEDSRFEDLNSDQRDAARDLGYNSDTWNCCINHFEDQTWQGMRTLYPAAWEANVALGWTVESWDSQSDLPMTEFKTWCRNAGADVEPLCLTKEEKRAAERLCYSESSFREDSLSGVPFEHYAEPGHCYDGPTRSPTTRHPTEEPTEPPTEHPTETPTDEPTEPPTERPTEAPTDSPTEPPTEAPTEAPTESPTTEAPTETPTETPTESPTERPTEAPTESPTEPPTATPTEPPTKSPTMCPSDEPSVPPTESSAPSSVPSDTPSSDPTVSSAPSEVPSGEPSSDPTVSSSPSGGPSEEPWAEPAEAEDEDEADAAASETATHETVESTG